MTYYVQCLQVAQPNQVIPLIGPDVDAELLDGGAVIHIFSHFHIAQITPLRNKILIQTYDAQACCTNNDQK